MILGSGQGIYLVSDKDTDTGAGGWQPVLAAGNFSGGENPIISANDFLTLAANTSYILGATGNTGNRDKLFIYQSPFLGDTADRSLLMISLADAYYFDFEKGYVIYSTSGEGVDSYWEYSAGTRQGSWRELIDNLLANNFAFTQKVIRNSNNVVTSFQAEFMPPNVNSKTKRVRLSGDYVEEFGAVVQNTLATTWQLITLTGAQPNNQVDVLVTNVGAAARTAGVRESGSTKARFVSTTGSNSIIVTTYTDASGRIEIYSSVIADIEFRLIGQISAP